MHIKIAELSKEIHKLATSKNIADIKTKENQLEELVYQLYSKELDIALPILKDFTSYLIIT